MLICCTWTTFGKSTSTIIVKETPINSIETQILQNTVTITVSGKRWSGNNHIYEVVRVANGILWESANMSAKNRGGHLVTISSQEENDFVFSLVSSSIHRHGYWLGGYQLPHSPEPDGGWVWVTGEPWVYSNWDVDEPNDGYIIGVSEWGPEDRLHFHWEDIPAWNDLPAGPIDNLPCGYIIEYE
jgi:hypothetical protein